MARMSRVPVLSMEEILRPAAPRPSHLLQRLQDAVPDIAWYDGELTRSVAGPFDGDRGLRGPSHNYATQRCVFSPGMTGTESEALVARCRAAGLNADDEVEREGQLDPETLVWGPRVWRVRIVES